MVRASKPGARGRLLADAWSEARDERWPAPQAAMLVCVASVLLWALLIALARWLIA